MSLLKILLAKKKKNRQFRYLITCTLFHKKNQEACQDQDRLRCCLVSPLSPPEVNRRSRRPPGPWMMRWREEFLQILRTRIQWTRAPPPVQVTYMTTSPSCNWEAGTSSVTLWQRKWSRKRGLSCSFSTRTRLDLRQWSGLPELDCPTPGRCPHSCNETWQSSANTPSQLYTPTSSWRCVQLVSWRISRRKIIRSASPGRQWQRPAGLLLYMGSRISPSAMEFVISMCNLY